MNTIDCDVNSIQWYEELKVEFKSTATRHSKRLASATHGDKNVFINKLSLNILKRLNIQYVYDLSLYNYFEEELKVIEEDECRGVIIRAKVKDIELEPGEKSNKYIFISS